MCREGRGSASCDPLVYPLSNGGRQSAVQFVQYGTILTYVSSVFMDQHECARLRAEAEHCRKLATAVNDRRSIEALNRTARDYDHEADRIEAEDAAGT